MPTKVPKAVLVRQLLPGGYQFRTLFPRYLHGCRALYHLLPLQALQLVLHYGGVYRIALCGGVGWGLGLYLRNLTGGFGIDWDLLKDSRNGGKQ